MGMYRRGDELKLSFGSEIVAVGFIQKLHPDEVVYNEKVGEGRVAVCVDTVIREDLLLPYPTPRAKYLRDSVHSLIFWDIKDTFLYDSPVEHRPAKRQSMGSINLHPVEGEKDEDGDELKVNDEILVLSADACILGSGIVHSCDKDFFCHFQRVGELRCTIEIRTVLAPDHLLAYPHDGAETVGEAVGTFVMWDRNYLRKILEPSLEETPLPASAEHSLRTSEGSNTVASTTPVVPDYTKRSSWKGELVALQSIETGVDVGFGRVTLVHKTDVVNVKEIGTTHVGVAVVGMIKKSHFPTIRSNPDGVIGLVSWPLTATKLVAARMLLSDLVKSGEQPVIIQDISENVIPAPEKIARRKSRPYGGLVRKKLTLAEKNQKVNRKRRKNLTEKELNDLHAKKCCPQSCIRNMHRDDLEALVREHEGMKFTDRITHIFTCFHNRQEDVKARSMFIVFGKEICSFAFHTVHGFSRRQFYRYLSDTKKGHKVGFHGNNATLKPRDKTMVARSIFDKICREGGEPMPHITYSGSNGTDTIEYRFPLSMRFSDLYDEVTSAMIAEGFETGCSEGTVRKIWRQYYNNFKFHKKGGNFAICDDCVRFKDRLGKERVASVRAEVEAERSEHLHEQMSRRNVYYTYRLVARTAPESHLCIIHDKMDQAKTGIPRLDWMPKSMSSGGIPLPVSLTGMKTHGRLPGVYAHFGITGLWPGDPDFTATSLAKCLRDLEEFDGDFSGDIYAGVTTCIEEMAQHTGRDIFHRLLDFNAFLLGYLIPKKIVTERYRNKMGRPTGEPLGVSTERVFKPLPRHLTLQMDNSSKDNKNQTIMAFCSELVSRGHFETVTMSFLMVGHTHEDVDAFFSKVSTRIKCREVATFPQLMAEVWESQGERPVPRLLVEVADYKAYLKRAQVSPVEGQSTVCAFLFAMEDNVPTYKYKFHVSDDWIPETGPGRCLWAKDPTTGEVHMPVGEPFSKPITDNWKKALEVTPYLDNLEKFLKVQCLNQETETFKQRDPLRKYWSRISSICAHPTELRLPGEGVVPMPLRSGFWPRTNHGTGHKPASASCARQEDLTPEIANKELAKLRKETEKERREFFRPFVGSRVEKEKEGWTPLNDIKIGHFIFIRPHDGWMKLNNFVEEKFWVVRALGSVDPNHPVEIEGASTSSPAVPQTFSPMFQIQWWRPKHNKANASDKWRYDDQILLPTKGWEVDPGYDGRVIWQKASDAFFGFKSGSKEDALAKNMKIPAAVLAKLTAYLQKIPQEGDDSSDDDTRKSDGAEFSSQNDSP